MTKPLPLSICVALAAAACRYPNEFRNTPGDAPHAVLGGTAYPHGGSVFPTHINGQPTSFWRSRDVFRVPVGTTTVRAAYSDRRETVGFAPVEFAATAGGHYVITRDRAPAVNSPVTAKSHPTTPNAWVIHDGCDRVTVRQKEASGQGRVLGDSPREGYVFGRPSPEAALAEYRGSNP